MCERPGVRSSLVLKGKVRFALLFQGSLMKRTGGALHYSNFVIATGQRRALLGNPGDRVLYHQVGMTRPAARACCVTFVSRVFTVSLQEICTDDKRSRKAELRAQTHTVSQASGGRVSLGLGPAVGAQSGSKRCLGWLSIDSDGPGDRESSLSDAGI